MFLKIFAFAYVGIILGCFPIIAQVTQREPLGMLSSIIVIILMVITLFPQLLLVSKTYRKELLSGIQDADGKTNREDLRYFASWSIPIFSFQTLVFISLFSLVSEREITNTLIWAFVAVTTGTALPQVKNFIKGTKEKKD